MIVVERQNTWRRAQKMNQKRQQPAATQILKKVSNFKLHDIFPPLWKLQYTSATGIYSSQCTSFLTEPRILAFDN